MSDNINKINKILDPQRGPVDYPHLHEVCRGRLQHMTEDLSRCDHLRRVQYFVGDTSLRERNLRSDDQLFYENNHPKATYRNDMDRMQVQLNSVCAHVRQRFDIYGYLGTGSYGAVFAARRRIGIRPGEFKHYALKVAEHETLVRCRNDGTPQIMGPWKDQVTGVSRFVPEEAVVMLFLGKSERFPTIDSVYTDDAFVTIVMSSTLDGDPRMNEEMYTQYDTKYHVYSGASMIWEKQTLLNEMQVCKIASQLVEALIYLRDMGMSHGDLSHRNYLLRENLDVQLIDFGIVNIGLKEEQWHTVLSMNNPYQEYILCPELAIELAKPYWMNIWPTKWECHPYLPHDPRAFEQWRFACIIFELLHGHAPWELPEYYELIGELYEFYKNMGWVDEDGVDIGAAGRDIVLQRREAIINTDVRIDEGMSQDCVDALRAMLARDPAKRPDPTHLEELASFPWFQGQWVDHGPFQRPTPPGEWYNRASS